MTLVCLLTTRSYDGLPSIYIHLSDSTPCSTAATAKYSVVELTHSLMELSPSWEDANCAAIQEIPSILWNPKAYYCVH
jgi:hypothetical protein